MIDRQRLVDLFLELVGIDSLSRRERTVALRLERELTALGATVEYDDAGAKVGGEVGNLIAHVPGTGADAAPLVLCAHMDTVAPGEGVRPVIEGDVIRSDGTTVLGGDDKSGCAIICEALRVLREQRIPHGPIDVVLTICEEVGLLGAKHLDADKVPARFGLVFDSDAPSLLFTRAPGANLVEATVEGLEAHAGMCPERGISAIQVAAAAIAAMRLGRLDAETTANLGLIQGGTAVNVVPRRVTVRGEARSHDLTKLAAQTAHMRACFEDAAARFTAMIDGRTVVPQVRVRVERSYEPMALPGASPIVRLVAEAARRLGRRVEAATMGGGCDANVLNRRGFEVANLGTGMRDIHTVREWLRIDDMVGTAEIVVELIRLHAGGA